MSDGGIEIFGCLYAIFWLSLITGIIILIVKFLF
jgi:hypothetical protein